MRKGRGEEKSDGDLEGCCGTQRTANTRKRGIGKRRDKSMGAAGLRKVDEISSEGGGTEGRTSYCNGQKAQVRIFNEK